MDELRRIKMGKRIILLAIILIAICATAFGQEKVTLTTYYPAPYGVYNELRAKTMGIGNTWYDPTTAPITGDTDLIVEGNVGIGTATPGAYKLNVNGNVYIGGDAVQTFIVPPSQRVAQKSTETVADQLLIPSLFPGLFPGM